MWVCEIEIERLACAQILFPRGSYLSSLPRSERTTFGLYVGVTLYLPRCKVADSTANACWQTGCSVYGTRFNSTARVKTPDKDKRVHLGTFLRIFANQAHSPEMILLLALPTEISGVSASTAERVTNLKGEEPVSFCGVFAGWVSRCGGSRLRGSHASDWVWG